MGILWAHTGAIGCIVTPQFTVILLTLHHTVLAQRSFTPKLHHKTINERFPVIPAPSACSSHVLQPDHFKATALPRRTN